MARNAQQFADRLLAALGKTPRPQDAKTARPQDQRADSTPVALVVPMQRASQDFVSRVRRARGA